MKKRLMVDNQGNIHGMIEINDGAPNVHQTEVGDKAVMMVQATHELFDVDIISADGLEDAEWQRMKRSESRRRQYVVSREGKQISLHQKVEGQKKERAFSWNQPN